MAESFVSKECPEYGAIYNKAYEEVMKQKIDLEKYIPKAYLEEMPNLEKTVFINRLQNYMIMKKIGRKCKKSSRYITQIHSKVHLRRRAKQCEVNILPEDWSQRDSNTCSTFRTGINISAPTIPGQSGHKQTIHLNDSDNSETWTPAQARITAEGKSWTTKQGKMRGRFDELLIQGQKTEFTITGNQRPSQENQQSFEGYQLVEARQLVSFLEQEMHWKMFLVQILKNRLIDADECEILYPSDELTLERAIMKKKEDYINELKSRYPKRNISTKSYCELVVASEDEFILFEECNEKNCHGHCPIHRSVKIVKDKFKDNQEKLGENSNTCLNWEKNVKTESSTSAINTSFQDYIPDNPASRSLPEGLILAPSEMTVAGLGVWTTQLFAKGTVFGPYGGVKVYSETEAHLSGYSWEIYKDGKLDHYIDAQDVTKSNWMRYVNCASSRFVQNLKAFQFSGDIYYRACVDIPANMEMVVWYGKKYAEDSGLVGKPTKSSGGFSHGDGMQLCTQSMKIPKTESCPSSLASSAVQVNVTFPSERRIDAMESIGSSLTESTQMRGGNGNRSSSRGNKSLRRKLFEDHKLGLYANKKEKERPNKCSVCEKAFIRKGSLNNHMRIHTKEQRFSCSVCGVKFSFFSYLERHMMMHSEEKPYDCSVCGLKFNQLSDFNRHVSIHTGEEPYNCTVCGTQFKKKSALSRHMRIHPAEKPFSCTVCGEQFKKKRALSRHIGIHPGEKPFSCIVCGERFKKERGLNRHMSIHSGAKPHSCTVCGVQFKSHLKRHMMIHTGEKPFGCTVCGVKFNQKSALNQHMKKIHAREKT